MSGSRAAGISARSCSGRAERLGAAQVAILGLVALSLGLSLWSIRRDVAPEWRLALPAPVPATGAPVFDTVLDYTPASGQAHSPAIAWQDDGFSVLWFEGSAEAQADVDIRHAPIRRGAGGWEAGPPAPLLTRADLGRAMVPRQIVVTLGNTIGNEIAPGDLYATVASIGGWAMASVVDVRMRDGRPVRARKLGLSPVLGRSNLVKSPMLAYADGSFALPAYFEMGATYGLLVRLDARGRVRDSRRITGAGKPIQPMIVALDQDRAVAFLRDFDPSHRLLVSRTRDGGQSWSPARDAGLENPSSPVAALALGGGRILMAVNDDAARPDLLRLALSADEGETWRVLHTFEGVGALRYPMLRHLGGGEIALVYSKGTKAGIVAHVFNRAWAEAQ